MENVGRSAPLGPTVGDGGVNFSVFSRSASGVALLLFDHVDDTRPAREIRLDPFVNRTYHYWHVFVPAVKPGQIYGDRAEGPSDPTRGMRFDPEQLLLDPYGRGVVVPRAYSRDVARKNGDNTATAMKSVVVDPSSYDWEGDVPPQRPCPRQAFFRIAANTPGFAPRRRNRGRSSGPGTTPCNSHT